MKRELYHIYMVDEYDGKEYKYLTAYNRIDAENTVLLLSSQNEPCTSYFYYNTDGIMYDSGDIKLMRGV